MNLQLQPVQQSNGSAVEMTDAVFEAIVRMAKDEAGLMITDKKRALVQSRISKRLRALGLPDFQSYLGMVQSGSNATELANMISVLTTNVSSFFREQHHFDQLQNYILPDLLGRALKGEKVRIWSAGCSSGQEPYTLAMLILEAEPKASTLDVKILATDIDMAILKRARDAEYEIAQLDAVPSNLRSKYFTRSASDQGKVAVESAVRNLISFKELNLLRDWPMNGKFNVIFCRNVVIYFDESTQRSLWPRFRSVLAGDGSMFIGHSERIPDPHQFGFSPDGVTSYRAA